MNSWENVLLTDSGFYYDNELDKPLNPLINRFRAMLDKPFQEAKVLFIPTAAMENAEKAAEITERLSNELLQLGVQPQNITIHHIDGSLSEEDAMGFDVIYLTGGKTRYLAKIVWETGFDKIIIKMVYANKVYIGMSAGSMLAMENFNVDGLPETSPMEFKGLGLINAYFSVHCQPGTPNRTDFPLPHIAMQCNQALEVNSMRYKLIEGVEMP
ncbi:MAG: peptidase E [Defluviitaleaceae bacterium]|nr:peptidase E [Defluviitaleaceae bacterium]